ncbi:hypothetical protein ACWCQ0_35270 [Streptomyces massasporeus]|uniref:4Fe-4S ferredoxin-type domain-containing protein n=1 Tax=Streptomyces massasporeus TaxID=67324 RepID=A0ABW6LMZ3_9ACTN
MRVMAQMAMVMNLDKCIGCHTCSVTCKQAWTNRTGVEYVWFNNVETRPGQGYPRRYEDQDTWKGGWELNKRGKLALKAGGRFTKLVQIFSNPVLPSLDDYYEPWTYDYETLTNAPLQEHTPVARPKSLISGKDMKIAWSANWDDDLGGSAATSERDVLLNELSEKIKLEFEQTFDPAPVDAVLRRLAAMRSYMRDINLGREPDAAIPQQVGMGEEQMYDMYRLLALAKYDERYVIPPAHAEQAHQLEELATECSLDYEGGPGMGGSGPFGETSGGAAPIAVENFHALRDRQTSDTPAGPTGKAARVNLLNWDGKGSPPGLFPDRPPGVTADDENDGGEVEPKP